MRDKVLSIVVTVIVFLGAGAYAQSTSESDSSSLTVLRAIASHKTEFSAREVTDAISSGLRSSSPRVRAQALWTLSSQVAEARFDQSATAAGRSARSRTVLLPLRPRVIEALADADPQVRIAAMGALGNLDYVVGGRVAAVGIGRDTARILVARLRVESSPSVRSELVKAFALMESAQAIDLGAERDDAIRAGLGDPDGDVVQFAALGVGRQQLGAFLPTVVALLRSPNLRVRMASAEAVSMFGTAALPHITALQAAADRETDPRVRQTLEGAILRIQGIR